MALGNTDIQTAKNIYSFMMKYPEYLMHVKKGFFRYDDLQYMAMTAKKFYREYKESPSCAQMKLLLKDQEDKVSPEAIEDYYNNDINSVDKEWLKRTVEGWIQYSTMIYHVSEVGTLCKTADVSYENAGEIVRKSMERLDLVKTVSFDDDLGMDFFDMDNHKSTKEDKVPFTWDYWNKSSDGGLDPKTLHVYIGGTNVGKSIILCNDAAEFVRRGKNVLFVTCEMSEQKVARRIGANLFNITLEEYDQYIENGKIRKLAKDFENMSLLPHGKLWIKEYPTGQCTVLDLESYLKKIQDEMKFKVDVIVIDYINIMCNYKNPNSENTYLKIKTLAEDLRGLAVKYNLIIDTASQIGRTAINSSDIELSDISESMGLAHTADSILAIIQTEDMQIGEIDEDTGVAVPYYWMKILKIREGKNKGKKFRVNINYSKMKLIEKAEDIDTMRHFK